MAKPVIYLIDKDVQNLQELAGYLRPFEKKFSIKMEQDPEKLLQPAQHEQEQEVALFICEDNFEQSHGLKTIKDLRDVFPKAKILLITDIHKKEATINAFKENYLDCYILKPFKPIDEKFIPIIQDMLIQWQGINDEADIEIKVVGPRWLPSLHKIMNFLSRNLFPYTFHDTEKDPKGWQLLKENHVSAPNQALVLFSDGTAMVDPEISEIAKKAGLNLDPENQFYDLIIIGAGPAGLAASVYASSEGLSTIIIEKEAPGGQAGASAHIANYLGFPGGISGEELSKRALAQAEKFGVELLSASEVKEIQYKKRYKTVTVNENLTISSHCILISTGVSYKKLETPGLHKFTGAGVYYGTVNTEAPLCEGLDVFIIGAGNSAGQAAMHLSHYAVKVRVLILEDSLEGTMSHYLIEQIENTPNIEIHPTTEVTEVFGNKRLEKINTLNKTTGENKEYSASAIFVFIGAEPQTAWLPEEIERDGDGFILTGIDLVKNGKKPTNWNTDRFPGILETSLPGIYAAGDIRHGSVKRVASAVGEGAMAVTFIHQYLNLYK